jgi:hypothetical protein
MPPILSVPTSSTRATAAARSSDVGHYSGSTTTAVP